MKTKNVIIIFILTSVILFFGLYFVYTSLNTNSVSIASYTSQDKQRPIVILEKDSYDFGEMKVSDKKSYDFVIKNTGKMPLQLTNISTSCGCTFAQIISDNKKSPEFDMHPKGNYIAEISPSKKATVRVTYKPYVMPVYGFVEREVYIQTNDPNYKEIILKVTANVK
ncbi:MAG: DUF1573 domain-containing protein [Patescibacteria group bacterium]